MAEDKGFKPSQRKLENARKHGRVLRSRVLTGSVSICAAFSITYLLICQCWVRMGKVINYCFIGRLSDIEGCFQQAAEIVLIAVTSILAAAAVAALLVECLQDGMRVVFGSMLRPGKGLSIGLGLDKTLKNLRKMPGNVLKVILSLCCLSGLCLAITSELAAGFFGPRAKWLDEALGMICKSWSWMSALLLTAGLTEYLAARRSFFRELSMSAAEIKKEQKDSEGDPLLKAWRRSLHESLIFQDLVRNVRRSRVIVTCRSESSK